MKKIHKLKKTGEFAEKTGWMLGLSYLHLFTLKADDAKIENNRLFLEIQTLFV